MAVNIGRSGAVRVSAVAFAVAVVGAPVAEAQYRRVQPYIAELPPPEARGCYFYRGRQFCGSYCYWEVNGKRYCQRRERNAHSQAPVVQGYDIEAYGPGLK